MSAMLVEENEEEEDEDEEADDDNEDPEADLEDFRAGHEHGETGDEVVLIDVGALPLGNQHGGE